MMIREDMVREDIRRAIAQLVAMALLEGSMSGVQAVAEDEDEDRVSLLIAGAAEGRVIAREMRDAAMADLLVLLVDLPEERR